MNTWWTPARLRFGLGIEDTFVPQSGPGERAVDEYELTEHYSRWSSDLELARGVGAEFLRWGVPWHRVNPEPDGWDFEWTDRVLNRMVELGIRPVVDLLHYGTPLWLDGEFANRDFPGRFAEFAARTAERYADIVTDYTPVNEPMIHAQFTGEYGYWPPYLTGTDGLNLIAVALAEASISAQDGIRGAVGTRAVIMHVDAGFRYTGDVDAPEHAAHVARLLEERYLFEDLMHGRVLEGHALHAGLIASGIDAERLARIAARPAPPDVMGVNYYPLHSTEVFEAGITHRGGFADPRPSRDAGTAGLREVLVGYAERYGHPVVLSETCITASEQRRIGWLRDSVDAVNSLRDEGIPVVGYTWWPLFDMIEWTWRHSTANPLAHRLTMGLYDLVATEGGLERRENSVAAVFRGLARENADAGSRVDAPIHWQP
ncbi:family 1 glycosylhydrolase [Rathayibacter sp. KR2-224]|uniref:family 1 glycosylhydrolase n=1 Tax=Rathayibacter sp. KR2-224 TaxID=3400913 RepID=UPI003C11DE59